MKIFVSGQIADTDNVRTIQQRLIEAGHHITHDWTRNETGDKMLGGRAAKLANPQEAARRAELDLQGVVSCDAYVICTDNADTGKGMYVELGAALGLHAVKGSPKIYLLGDMNHMSIFYLHPAVVHLESVDALIDALA